MRDSTDTEPEADAESTEEWVPLEDRREEKDTASPAQPFGSVNEKEAVDSEDGHDDAMYPWAEGRGSTSGDAPWLGDDPQEGAVGPSYDVPRYVEILGQSGVYLGVAALALAIGGVLLAAVDIQPYGNMAIVFSLAGIVAAMLLGVVFQVYVSVGDS
jgi:hypothetical protein